MQTALGDKRPSTKLTVEGLADGSHGRAMGRPQATHARAPASPRWPRPPGARRPGRMNGVLWIWRTGAPWKELPTRYPPYHTCQRRVPQWARSGVRDRLLRALATDLVERGGIDLSECCIDGTVVVAKQGGRCGTDHAGPRDEGHGRGRPCWSASRHPHGQGFAACSHPCRTNSRRVCGR
jgi:transposase